MAEKTTIARPYAKALFELAFDRGAMEAWSNVLAVAAQVAADERVRKLFVSPHLTVNDLTELFIAIIGPVVHKDRDIDEHARNFIRTLASNRRLALLPEIATIFARLKADSEDAVDVTVTSAVPLDGKLELSYGGALSKRLRKKIVRLHPEVDPTLLGGAILRANDLVIDGSLRGRLERLSAEVTG